MPDAKSLLRSTIQSKMLIASATGADVSSFPFIKLLASYQFINDTGLVGLTISSSIINTTTGIAGIFIAQTQAETINLTQTSPTGIPANIYISQITHQNSPVGTTAPAARTNSLAFGEATSILPLRAGSGIAIYGCGDNFTANKFAAALSIYTITL
jgi:hypothetical protein